MHAPGVCASNGVGNRVWDDYGTVAGGGANRVGDYDGDPTSAKYATGGGGRRNQAIGRGSVIAGGLLNTARGQDATVPGGQGNSAGGAWSFAAGGNARVRDAEQVVADEGGVDTDGDEGTFVWSDATGGPFTSTGPNQFLIDAAGGVGIGTNEPNANSQLHVDKGGDGAAIYAASHSGADTGIAPNLLLLSGLFMVSRRANKA